MGKWLICGTVMLEPLGMMVTWKALQGIQLIIFMGEGRPTQKELTTSKSSITTTRARNLPLKTDTGNG